MKPVSILFLLIYIDAKLLPITSDIQPHDIKTFELIQDLVLESIDRKSLNAVQLFSMGIKGDFFINNLMTSISSFEDLANNFTYQIGFGTPISDEPGEIMTLLFVDDTISLKNLTTSLRKAIYPIGRYFIVKFSSCGSINNRLSTIKEMFEEFWNLQVVDVILMCRVSEITLLYTFYPYSKDHCNMVEPVLIEFGDDYFPSKNSDFHGCKLKGGVSNEPPHFINGTSKGIDAEMIKLFSKALNFEFHPEILTLNESNEAHDFDKDFFKQVVLTWIN